MPAPFRNQEHLLIGQEQKAPDSQEHLEPRIETARARDKHRDRRGREEPVVLPRRRVWSSESARGRRKAWLAGWLLRWNSHFLSLSGRENSAWELRRARSFIYVREDELCSPQAARRRICDCARGGNGDGLPGPALCQLLGLIFTGGHALPYLGDEVSFWWEIWRGRINVFQGEASKISLRGAMQRVNWVLS